MTLDKIQTQVFVGTRKFSWEAHKALEKASKERSGLCYVNAIKCVQSDWFVNYPKVDYEDQDEDEEGILVFQKLHFSAEDFVNGTDYLVYQSQFVDKNKEAIDELHHRVLDIAEPMLSNLTENVRVNTHIMLQILTQHLVKSVGMKEYSEIPEMSEDQKICVMKRTNLALLERVPQLDKRILILADNSYVLNEKCDFDHLIGKGMTAKIRSLHRSVHEFLKAKKQSQLEKTSSDICNILIELDSDNHKNLPSIYL